ncbi:MAG: ECF-type sigma factor [Planctomycetota bacterium]
MEAAKTGQNDSIGVNGSPTRDALDAVVAEVYQELRELAAKTMAGSPVGLTLQPTALVGEAYLRLRNERNGWPDRENFMVAASVAMRRALVDHIRRRNAAKRGRSLRVDTPVETIAVAGREVDVMEIDELLRRLETEDAESARVVELMIFGGATSKVTAAALGVSTRTVERRWRFARAWLFDAMSEGASA